MTLVGCSDTFYEVVENTARDLYIKALKDLPPDVRSALVEARKKETSTTARETLNIILKNIEIADKENMLICQDTGIPIYWVSIGTLLRVDGAKLGKALVRGAERATVEHPFRSSVCSPLSRKNPQTSTGHRIPIIHYEYIEGGQCLELLMVPKGSGAENMSFLKMLVPADGIAGVKKFIIDSVVEAGGKPCPPGVVGVGIGGTADLSVTLAKKAISRPVGSSNPCAEFAQLEDKLLRAINSTGIGSMGLGGAVTSLAVHIEQAHTHITQLPVAVNMQCWAARRARARVYPDGSVEIGY